MPAIYQHAVGVALSACLPPDTELDLTGASIETSLRKPGGSILCVESTLDDVERKVTYTTVRGDLDEPGSYQWRVTLVYTDGRRIPTDPVWFNVWGLDRQG